MKSILAICVLEMKIQTCCTVQFEHLKEFGKDDILIKKKKKSKSWKTPETTEELYMII